MIEVLYKGKRAYFEYPEIRHFVWNPRTRKFEPAPEEPETTGQMCLWDDGDDGDERPPWE